MSNCFSGNLSELAQSQLNQFKEYAISHPQLAQVDMLLMGAIREPAGFAHVLVYGPSGVGKTTMIRQITRRLNGTTVDQNGSYSWSESGYRNGNVSPMPLLLVETRPPDGGVFNRTDYYRTALRLLGEPFYERRMMVDIDAEQTWEKKGRGRSKTAQFNDSPELRQDFQGILLALLKQVPLEIDIPALMQHWVYFYERSIGCVGVLKDWLIRAVAAALHDGCDTLTLERLHEHTLSLAQCERMAIEATEGEQKLCYMESRREHLWHLLQMGMTSTSVPGGIVDLSPGVKSTVAPVSSSANSKSTRKKRSEPETVQADTQYPVSMASSPEPKKKQTRKKKEAPVAVTETMQDSQETTQDTQTSMTEVAFVQTQPKKRQTRKKKESPVVVTETTQHTLSSVTETVEVQTPPNSRRTQHKKDTVVVSESMPQDTPSSKNEVISLTTESENVEAVPKKNSRRSVGQRKPQRDKVGE